MSLRMENYQHDLYVEKAQIQFSQDVDKPPVLLKNTSCEKVQI